MLNLRRLACMLLLPIVVSCQSDRYSITSSLAPDQTAQVIVLGKLPRIRLENGGPGQMSIQFTDSKEGSESITLNATGSSMRALHGPVTVIFRADGQGCSYKITAFECEGLAADMLVESPTR